MRTALSSHLTLKLPISFWDLFRFLLKPHFPQFVEMATCIRLHSGGTFALSSISMQRVSFSRLGDNKATLLTRRRSPHWLMKHNRYVDAWRVFSSLRETPLQAASSLLLPSNHFR